MENQEIIKKLNSNGWQEKNISELPINKLNEGVKIYLLYKDRISFRYHPEEKFIRLMIHGGEEESCIQIEYKNKIEKVIEQIIAIQDALIMDYYLSHYLKLQSICPVSILMLDHFL